MYRTLKTYNLSSICQGLHLLIVTCHLAFFYMACKQYNVAGLCDAPKLHVVFGMVTCSEIWSKILIRGVTSHWACDCSFRSLRHLQCKTKTEREHREQDGLRDHRDCENSWKDSFLVLIPGFYRFSALCYPM